MEEATTGLLLAGLPIEVADLDADAAIRRAFDITLSRFRSGVPHPDFRGWCINETPVVKVAGCRTWREFVKRTKHVAVEFNEEYRLLPHRRAGAKGAFLPIVEATIVVRSLDDIPLALRTAFERAPAD